MTIERKRINEKNNQVGLIAIRFSNEDTPLGWSALDEQEIPLYVIGTEQGLVYLFSSAYWSDIQQKLHSSNLLYEFKQSFGFTRKTINDPDSWNKYIPENKK